MPLPAAYLPNIQAESSFNPNIYGDSGSSYGICQWHNERFTALKNYTEEWDTLQGQLEYLHYELKTSYPSLWSSLKSASNDTDGAIKLPMTGVLFLKSQPICTLWLFPEAILPKILTGRNIQEQLFQATTQSLFPVPLRQVQ
mgnify:CR=1 FL=1